MFQFQQKKNSQYFFDKNKQTNNYKACRHSRLGTSKILLEVSDIDRI